MIVNRNILISGAGIAGLTLAYWLRHYGFSPTIVEQRPDLRDAGYMIDFYGSGFDVADRMGLLDALRARHYPIPSLQFVDDRGRTQARLDIDRMRRLLRYRHFNFMRGDLADVLFEAVRPDVPIHFNTSIARLDAGPERVAVELDAGSQESFDLVIGADGVHSRVRRLAWGDAPQFERFLGYHVACGIVDNRFGAADEFRSHLQPGTHAALYAIRGDRLATLFAFRSQQRSLHDRLAQRDLLMHTFGRQGWIVPQLAEATTQGGHFFFGSVSQVQMSPWHTGRVALVGDACQCLTLLAGQGASMAMAGAYLLARELHRAGGRHEQAFAAYEARLKPEIERRQIEARKLARSFVPDSTWDIRKMYLFLKVAFLPPFSAIFRRQVGADSLIE